METIKEQIFYHICKYPEYDITLNEKNTTCGISRNWDDSPNNKRERELSFEQYRIDYCPQMPSRRNCFYVCPEHKVEMWLRKLIRLENRWYKIYKLSVTGDIHWVDENDYMDNLPESYWNGCDYLDEQFLPEGLFIGEYIALEECTNSFQRS